MVFKFGFINNVLFSNNIQQNLLQYRISVNVVMFTLVECFSQLFDQNEMIMYCSDLVTAGVLR